MTTLSIPALRTGGPAFLPQSHILKAGPLTLLLEEGELRRISLGEREILRRIYLTLRGPDWSPVIPSLSDLRVDAREDSFEASFLLVHRRDAFDFTWRVALSGSSRGDVRFHAQGRAGKAFSTNRVGLCVLHPLEACVGRPVRLVGSDGASREGRFPERISPDEAFKDIREFAYQPEGLGRAKLTYAGEVFEMEDQRNWSDGSFKTYCPPQALPKPRRIEAGWETALSVTLELPGEGVARTTPAAASLPILRLDPDRGHALPSLGLGMASHGQALGREDRDRLKALGLSHLRANFRLSDVGTPAHIARAGREALDLGLGLEAALVVPGNADAALYAFAEAWRQAGGPVARWLVFSEQHDRTPEALLAYARRHLQGLDPKAEFALGSKSDFVLLNRDRPEPGRDRPGPGTPETLVYAVCPQVHAFDNRTLVEALEGQEWTVRTARALWPDNPLAVSAITLKRSPFVLGLKPGGTSPGWTWRNQADPRQLSLFGAGWTLASLARLAVHGASAATYYETTGSLGVMAGETSGEKDRTFLGTDLAAQPGWAYPLYHVFADWAEFRGGEALAVASSHPQRFAGVGLKSGIRRTLLLANLESVAGKVRVAGLGRVTGVRRLNESNAQEAMMDPGAFRRRPYELLARDQEEFELDLLPFELVRLEWEPA